MAYSLPLRPGHLLSLYRYHRRSTARMAEGTVEAFRDTVAFLETRLGKPVREMDVLEVGCGQRCQNVLLFNAAGARVTGGDLEHTGPGMAKYLRMALAGQFGRTLKTAGRAVLFDGEYYRTLEKSFGGRMSWDGVRVVRLDASRLPFADSSFDAVVSTAVFEHLPDPGAAVKEIARVLRKDGVCRIVVHLFPSLSGGHHLEWVDPDPAAPPPVPAWDHLRGNTSPSHVFLNRLRRRDYEEVFREYMEVEESVATKSGTEFLTPELEAELAAKGWPREELLATSLTIVAGPHKGTARTA